MKGLGRLNEDGRALHGQARHWTQGRWGDRLAVGCGRWAAAGRHSGAAGGQRSGRGCNSRDGSLEVEARWTRTRGRGEGSARAS